MFELSVLKLIVLSLAILALAVIVLLPAVSWYLDWLKRRDRRIRVDSFMEGQRVCQWQHEHADRERDETIRALFAMLNDAGGRHTNGRAEGSLG